MDPKQQQQHQKQQQQQQQQVEPLGENQGENNHEIVEEKDNENREEDKKSMTSPLTSLLQDALIKIPFFHSHTETNMLAIEIENQIYGDIEAVERIFKIVQKEKVNMNIVSSQIKLHYHGFIPRKVMIVQFNEISDAKRFHQLYHRKQQILSNNSNNNKNESGSNQEENTLSTVTGTAIATVTEEQKKKQQQQKLQQDWKIQRYNVQKQMIKPHEDNLFNICFCLAVEVINNLQGIFFEYGKICVQSPQSPELRRIIKNISKLIVVEGIRGQQQLFRIFEDTEIKGPELNFLNSKTISSEHIYYKWRVYSYLQGDGDTHYRAQPFQIVRGGALWYPPDQSVEKYYSYARVLGWKQRIYFSDVLLQGITSRKFHIQEAMAFAIFNIENAVEISAIIALKFTELCTHNPQNLIPLIQLISDILFNSPTFIYREIFTSILPELLHFFTMNAHQPSITATVTTNLSQIVDLWQKKYILEEELCKGLSFMLGNWREIRGCFCEKKGEGVLLRNAYQRTIFKEIQGQYQGQEDCKDVFAKYGISKKMIEKSIGLQIIAILMSNDRMQTLKEAMIPELSAQYDGEELSDKDLSKIKTKSCKVFTCSGIPIKNLFPSSSDPNKNSSINSSID